MSSATAEGGRGTAIVTGGARGLGRAFAEALARTGHHVAICDLSDASQTASAIGEAGGHCLVFQGDAADSTVVAEFGAQVRATCPPVRVLVNNVGISPYAGFEATSAEVWHEVLRVNLDSMFHACQQFLGDLRAHGSGRIVNLTSSVVWDAQITAMTAYATSKAAIVGFTRALAAEVGVDGVTVNAIAPGIVLTPDIEGRVDAAKLEGYRQRQAVKRLTVADDLVSTLLYLVDESTALVTGAVLPVNGGRVWT